ncbi:MAG TPA: CoA transferase, partial [Dehalococcoidia bacterium]|nr:CoA transferase [Dehalococcoidia bacterium]
EEIAAWTRGRTKFEAMEYLAEHGVPASAVFDTRDILEHPHLLERGQVISYEHPTRGEMRVPAPPIHLSESEVALRAAPLLGEHTGDVLREELRMSADELKRLNDGGVVGGVAEGEAAAIS